MKIIICGAEEVGFSLARYLAAEDMQVTVIDENSDRLQKIASSIDVRTLIGKIFNPNILKEANASDTDLLISVTDNDESNILACEIAKIIFKVPRTMARIKEKDLLEEKWFDLFSNDGFKVDNVISPEGEVAKMLARLVAVSGAHDLISFVDDKIRLIGVKLDHDCPVLETPLAQLTELFPDLKTKIVLMVRNEKVFIPNKMEQLEASDDIYMLADSKNTFRILSVFGKKQIKQRKIIIIGAGRIAINIAKILETNEPDSSITIIENNKVKAEKAAVTLEKATVLLGDAVESEIIKEANIPDADIVFSVTNSDEINTLVSVLSKKAGAKNCYALLNEDKYQPVIPFLDIDGIISPRDLTVSKVLTFIRKGMVSNVFELRDGAAEIIEFQIREGSKLLGVPIKDSKLPSEALIGAIVRDKEVITPKGDTIIENNDIIVLCLLHEAVHKIEEFLSDDTILI
ncbi:MAG: Trk system potassium transporter TrkA [Rickettsiales bacterium]|nr:Trk system potassium transporter TrkA [Rickettsiales bacterium]